MVVHRGSMMDIMGAPVVTVTIISVRQCTDNVLLWLRSPLSLCTSVLTTYSCGYSHHYHCAPLDWQCTPVVTVTVISVHHSTDNVRLWLQSPLLCTTVLTMVTVTIIILHHSTDNVLWWLQSPLSLYITVLTMYSCGNHYRCAPLYWQWLQSPLSLCTTVLTMYSCGYCHCYHCASQYLQCIPVVTVTVVTVHHSTDNVLLWLQLLFLCTTVLTMYSCGYSHRYHCAPLYWQCIPVVTVTVIVHHSADNVFLWLQSLLSWCTTVLTMYSCGYSHSYHCAPLCWQCTPVVTVTVIIVHHCTDNVLLWLRSPLSLCTTHCWVLGTVPSVGQGGESFWGVFVLLQHAEDGQGPFHSLGCVQLSCQRACGNIHIKKANVLQVQKRTFLSQLLVQTLLVFAQPPCAIACINICARVWTPRRWQPYHCLDTKIQHTIGQSLEADCPCPGGKELKSVTCGRLQINSHASYVCGFAWSDMVHGSMVYTEHAMTVAVSGGTSCVSAVSIPLQWVFKNMP